MGTQVHGARGQVHEAREEGAHGGLECRVGSAGVGVRVRWHHPWSFARRAVASPPPAPQAPPEHIGHGEAARSWVSVMTDHTHPGAAAGAAHSPSISQLSAPSTKLGPATGSAAFFR